MRKYVVLTALVLIVGFAQLSPAATWTIEQVTTNTEPDQYPFATTVGDYIIITYSHNDGDWEAFAASNQSGPWVSSRITDNTLTDMPLDIASRPGEDFVHIALWWQELPDQEISYCKGNLSGWDIERVTDDAANDMWPSIEVDKNGFAHIVYQKTIGDQEIFYANNVTGSWLSEQVTDNAVNEMYPWLALDSEGNPHIVFTMAANLFYIKKVAGVWTSPELVTGGLGVSSYPYLVLDNEDNVHVCYSKNDGVDWEIHYANNVTGSWQESKVTSNNYNDLYPTLFIDPYKKAHIAYLAAEPSDAEIFYANNVAGIWDIGRVTDNDVNDLAFLGRYFIPDQQGRGHIFFWNNSDGDDEIYHAYSNEPLYVVGVEETPAAITPASIQVNPNPFSSRTTVSYSVPAAGNVSLKVYDVSGSLVRTLVDGAQEQGVYRIVWDGSSDAGARTAPGVYFYRLEISGVSASVKGILK